MFWALMFCLSLLVMIKGYTTYGFDSVKQGVYDVEKTIEVSPDMCVECTGDLSRSFQEEGLPEKSMEFSKINDKYSKDLPLHLRNKSKEVVVVTENKLKKIVEVELEKTSLNKSVKLIGSSILHNLEADIYICNKASNLEHLVLNPECIIIIISKTAKRKSLKTLVIDGKRHKVCTLYPGLLGQFLCNALKGVVLRRQPSRSFV